MSAQQTASEIDDDAAAWAVRIDARDLEPADDPELQTWLSADARRHGALLRAQAALSFLDRGRALAGADDPAAIARRGPSRRTLLIGAGAGGGALAAGLGAAVLLGGEVSRYSTGLGEIRQVPLKDGSVVAINTRSAIEVRLGRRPRGVTPPAGGALVGGATGRAAPLRRPAGADGGGRRGGRAL